VAADGRKLLMWISRLSAAAALHRYLAPQTVLPLVHRCIHNVAKHREVSWQRVWFELGWQVAKQREVERQGR
jgi:hypothetical protein